MNRSTFDIILYEDGTVEASGDNGVVVIDDIDIPEICIMCPDVTVSCTMDCEVCAIVEESCDECASAVCMDEDTGEEEPVDEVSEEEVEVVVEDNCPTNYFLIL